MSKKIDSIKETDLQDLVASNDTGGRNPTKLEKNIITLVAISWSLFQIYFASPLPYIIQEWLANIGIIQFFQSHGMAFTVVLDDTKARSIHLAFALFLAFLSYPAFKSSPRNKIPQTDWMLAIIGTFLGAYYFLFYRDLAGRVGSPNTTDVIAGICGILILLEATRRSLGAPLAIIAIFFLTFNLVGPYLPQLIAHNANKLTTIVNQQWITTEGVFGVPLGVSTKFVFLFVLFGALLDKAGAGNYFIQTAFSVLGHLRGGPAKAAVVASGLTGLISGSSIANVVTTGTFTVPMMKKVGFSPEKSGAVEVASSVNGQIMPPVMGAAAFLIMQNLNLSYLEVVKSAIVPALISYIALFYIVHLEALKADMQGLKRAKEPPVLLIRLRNMALIIFSICLLSFAVYYGLGWIHTLFGQYSGWIIAVLFIITYILIVRWCSAFPTLDPNSLNKDIVELPPVKETVNSGLHFLLPVIVLIWCLMVEQLSAGLSAFWGTVCLIFILITQKPLFAFFRGNQNLGSHFKEGFKDLFDGLETGARNMIGIAIATAAAGIIVGVVALTNIGAPLAAVVEILSGGHILLMLILVAILSLILGMGLPTTANYIIVSSLLASVILEVGRQNGLVVPAIAVHLFVFYFGIMADVTPPVGLASFAAAAISRGDPIKTGFVAFFYSLRTAILPFLFIFNTDLILYNVEPLHAIFVFFISTVAILVFTAASQRFFYDHCKWYEVILLLLIAFTLFRPGFFMEKVSPSYKEVQGTEFLQALEEAPQGRNLIMHVSGYNKVGKEITFVSSLPIHGETLEDRLNNIGIVVVEQDQKLVIDDVLDFVPSIEDPNKEVRSPAKESGLDWDQVILDAKIPKASYTAKEWFYIPAIFLLILIAQMQSRRRHNRQKEKQILKEV